MTDYGRKFIQGTIIVLFFSLISAILGFFLKTIMARTIDVETIGLFFSVLGFITFFTFLRDLGLSDSLVYFLPLFKQKNNKKEIKRAILLTLKTQFFFGFLFFLLFIIFSNFLTENYFKNQNAVYLIIFLGLYFFLDGIHETLMRIFHGYKNYFYMQAIDFSFQFFSSLFLIYSIIFLKNVLFFALSYIIAEIITIIIFSFVFFKKFFPDFFSIKITKNKKQEKKLFNFSIPTMIATIGELSYSQQTIFFLTFFSGLESVGYYVLVNSLAKLSVFLYKATSRVFSPLITEMWIKKDYEKLNYYFKEQFILIFSIAIPSSFILIFFSEIVINLIYGTKYENVSNILFISSIVVLLQLFNNFFNHLSMGIGKPKFYRNNVYIKTMFNFIFNLFLIPKFGLIGAVFSDLLSVIFATAHILYFVLSLKKFFIPIKEFFYLFLSGIAFVFSILFLKNIFSLNPYLEMIFVLFLSGIIYLSSLFITKTYSIKKFFSIFYSIFGKQK
ncbi:MAG: oligosaccharide flippase family protein [Candidatus Woesearchaeota archaeon]